MTNHELYKVFSKMRKCFEKQSNMCLDECYDCPYLISLEEIKAAKEKLEELIRTEDDLK